MERDRENLQLIAEAALKITRFLDGVDAPRFLEDEKTQSAVIMQLVVIGELAKKLSVEAKKNIDLPWRMIAGFRDLAVHEYFQLDLHKVLETASKNIPELLEKIRQGL
jgi:uncharacterized protein with HEPN domain